MKTPQLIIDFLNPGFLKRLDRYLLLNYPRLWISKIHYVFYYGALANVILNFLVFIFFSEPSQSHLIDEFIGFIIFIVMLIEVAAFVYWFLKQCLFNIEKEYGNYHFTDGIIEIIIYTMCTLIIFSSSLTMTATAIHRVANNDKNAIITHKTDCGLEYWQFIDGLTKKEREVQKSLSIKWQSKFCYKGERCSKSSNICRDIQEFITNDIDESRDLEDYFPRELQYNAYYFFHTMFAILGILFLIIRKHSNWRIIGWIILYIIILTILGIFLGIFLNSVESKLFTFIDTIFFHVDLSSSSTQFLVGLVFLIILLMIVTSIQLARKRKYAQFLYINFLSLPIAVGVLFFSLYVISNTSATTKEITLFLIKFFVAYSFLVPLQKMVFNRVLSLPKE